MPEILLHNYTARIKEMIRNDHHDEAIAHCQHVLRLYPKHVETYCLLGEACLEKEMYREAIECFQRTLGADPENLISRVGLGIILGEQGMLPEAIWQMERAFELAPGNTEVRRELQRLYTQRDSVEKARLKLTPGALGRLYARNGLYDRAITEFRSLLRQDPNLPDIRVALAEALWHDGRRLEAVDVCLDLLSMLPNCLKANLILGEIWIRGGNEDAGEEKLNVARALDPENLTAQAMMSKDSPLPPQEVLIPQLEVLPAQSWIVPPTVEQEMEREVEQEEFVSETPDWVRDLEREEQIPSLPIEEAPEGLAAVEEAAPAEEIPEWLRELGMIGAGVVVVAEATAPAGEEEIAPAEELPDWLRELDAAEGAPLAAAGIAMLGEEIPPEEVVPEAEAAPAEELPDWLRELGAAEGAPLAAAEIATPGEEIPPEEVVPEAEAAPAEELPDWLRELGAAEGVPAAAAGIAMLGEEIPPEEVVPEAEPAPEEVPGRPRELGAAEGALVAVAAVVTLGKEILPEEVVPEAEAAPAEEAPGWLRELGAAEGAPVAVAAIATVGKEISPEEVAPAAEVVPAEEVPDWLQEPGIAEGEGAVAPPEVEAPVAEVILPEEAAPVGQVPESLKALVEAGMLDEADLAAAMAQMTPEELAAQRTEAVPDWLKDLLGEEPALAVEVAAAPPEAEIPLVELPPLEVAAPVEEVAAVESAEEIPDWLKDLGVAEVEEAAAPEVEIPAVELPSLGVAALVGEVLAPEEAAPVGQVPESLQALVEAGMLDEADLAAAMAEMTPEELAAQRTEAVPDWLKDLLGPGGEAAPTVEVAAVPPETEIPVVEPPPLEVVAGEEIPEWLKELGIAEAEQAAAPEAEIPLVELPPLEVLAPVAEVPSGEEVPEWLRELGVPVAEEPLPPSVVSVEEMAGAEVEPEVVSAMEVPEWLRELEVPGAERVSPPVELPVEELVPGAVAEAAPELVLPVEEALPALEVAPPPVEEFVPGAVVEAAPEVPPPVEEAAPVLEVALPPVEELVPGAVVEAAPEVVLPVEQAAPELVPEEVVALVEEVVPPSRLDDLLGQLKARPRDYQLQLELARLYRGQRDWNGAFKYYEKLIAARRLLPAVIDDMQPLAGADVDLVRLYQLLGDAYMHEDRLDEALSMYRQAREALAR